MNQITCLSDMINHTPRVRVIKEGDKLYGQEFDIVSNNHFAKQIAIHINNVNTYFYTYSKIQFLTPVQYEGRYIGLGDKVHGYEVMGYYWNGEEWALRYTNTENYSNISSFSAGRIKIFEPLHKLAPKIELSTEELVEELKRRGVVTQGNIINNNISK